MFLKILNNQQYLKEFLIKKFPFLLNFRRKRKVVLDRKVYSVIMLHNIPKNKNYFYFSTLKDWIDIVNLLSRNFKIVFLPKKKDEIAITIDDGFKMIKPFLNFFIKKKIPITVFISPLGFENKIYPYSVFIQFFRRFEGDIFIYKNYKVKFSTQNTVCLKKHIDR